jgi:hypothetical protein
MKASSVALLVIVALTGTAHPQFTDWSTPTNVGPPINTTSVEVAPFLSKDGLTLYFSRDTPIAD